MPIEFPTYTNLIDRTRSDVRNQLPDSDPTIFGSFIRAITDSTASRAYDIVLLVEQALEQFFPQTADGEFIDRWAGYEGLTRLSATASSGMVIVTGTTGTVIPVNTQLQTANGNLYRVDAGVSISTNNFSISSITRTGTTATVTTATSHNLGSGATVTIAGANEAAYNGDFVVAVLSSTTFQYTVSGSPATPATGTITGEIDSANVTIESVGTGQDKNLDNGATLTFVSPIAGADSTAIVQFEGILGGTDDETDDELRVRVLQSRENPVANFNAAAIEKQARTVSGVTRVFVKPITPLIGDVTIYFFRDNDANPIPTASEIQDVEDAILEILPAASDPSNVYVQAPTIVTTDFTFASISPDTPTMRAAITNSLTAFFEDRVEFETDVSQDLYRLAIAETQDLQTGQFLESFLLSSPAGTINVNTGEIAGLGEVNF